MADRVNKMVWFLFCFSFFRQDKKFLKHISICDKLKIHGYWGNK